MDSHSLPIPHSQLVAELSSLGVGPGQVVMLHASIRSIGWIVGGPDTILDALLGLLTPAGTLCMYISWEEWERTLVSFSDLAPGQQQIYHAECPPFDPQTSRGNREYSILAEYIRTRPGAYRSNHPTASVSAIGAQAQWITADHPLNYGYGYGSPWDKVVQLGGKILLLGSPLNSVTLLHYAEHISRIPNKKIVHNRVPLLLDGQRVWIEFEEYDTCWGIRNWESEEYFSVILHEYLSSGHGRRGRIGGADSYLLDAAELAGFAVEWIERIWKE